VWLPRITKGSVSCAYLESMLEGTLGEMLELQQASEVSRADTPTHEDHWPQAPAARAASASTGKPPSHTFI
jgi:hypothetical protein